MCFYSHLIHGEDAQKEKKERKKESNLLRLLCEKWQSWGSTPGLLISRASPLNHML